MKRLSYLLILILLLVQLDDSWAIAHIMPTGPLPDDSQEYLPSQPPTRGVESSSCQSPLFTDLKPQTANFLFVPGCFSCQWIVVAAFATSPLYIFMSLQI
jgi:hypothetical protein